MYMNKQGLREIGRVLLKKPTVGRLVTTVWIAPLYLVMRQLTSLFRALDEQLYPEYRQQKIERPVFVFANPRSGTTLTHRLLSMDEESFTTVKLYQTIFPALSANRMFELLARHSQSRPGSVLRRLFDFFNAPLKGRLDAVHEVGLDQPEEDVCTLLWHLSSPATGLLFPFIDDLTSQTWIDRQPPVERGAFLDSYERTIKRHVYEGGGKRFLNKNVFFATRVRSIRERFPDAVFVYLVRNPYESLPSFLDLFYRAWRAHSPRIRPDGEEVQALKRLGYDYYRYALECRDDIPGDQFLTIRYDDLVADPKKTIVTLYRRLGMPVRKAFEAKLDEAAAAQPEHTSSRTVDLEYFGISREEVYAELSEVFETFGNGEWR